MVSSSTLYKPNRSGSSSMQIMQPQLMSRLSLSSQPRGNDIVSFRVIDPPDDRYLPGYSVTQADGDTKTVGPRLKDLNIPFSLYGLPIPVTFGVRRLYGNMVWTVPLRENVVKKKKGGGKGGGAKTKSTEYEYYATFAVAFGVNGVQATTSRDVLRVWADGSLIYDRRSTGQTKIEGFNFVFYGGDEDQMPDPTMEEREGVGLVPPYRGMMLMVIKDLPVAAWGDRPPAISIEVGDSTSPRTSVTNIYPDAVNGSREQDDLIVDWSRFQAVTLRQADNTLRVYDLINNAVIGQGAINNGAGVGWATNDASMTDLDLQLTTGYSTTGSPAYIPWLGKIVASISASGRVPVFMADASSGIVTHWIGARALGVTPEFPANDFVPAVEAARIGGLPYFKGYIPFPDYYCPQLVYGLYNMDTYIFCVSNVYTEMVVLHFRGVDETLDMLTYENGADYQEVVGGTKAYGYSDSFLVDGSVIYRVRLDAGAKRTRSGTSDIVTGYTKTTWKTMGSGINNIFYYEPDDTLIVLLDNGSIFKYACADGSEIVSEVVTGTLPPAHFPNKNMADLSNGSFAYDTGADIREIDMVFCTVTDHTGQGSGLAANGKVYDSKSKSIVGIGSSGTGSPGTGQTDSMAEAVSRLFFDRLGDDRITLASFLEGISVLAGYAPADVDVSADIDDMIDGAIISNVTTFGNIMSPVSALYRFDIIESGGQVKFIRKPVGFAATDFAIGQGGGLLDSENNPDGVTFQFRREEEIAVPQRVNIRYLDKHLSYQWAIQHSTRSRAIETNQSNNQITYEVPIIMTSSEAKALSYKALWTAWNSRVSYGFRLGAKHIKIEPGDVGTFISNGLQYTIKAVEVTYHNDFSITVRGSGYLADESITVVADDVGGYPQIIPYTFASSAYILDIPLLEAAHDLNYAGHFPVYAYVGPAIPTTSWGGGSLWNAYDSLNYEEEVSNTLEGFVGIVPDILTVPDSILSTDTLNTMTVWPKEGDSTHLASCTELEMLNGANVAAYGANGRWEVIQFQTVTDNGNGSFTLSNILRGRRGTDYAVDYHRTGDTFVLLDAQWMELLSFTAADMEMSFRYKGVSFGKDQSTVIPSLVTLNGYGARPWPPVNLTIDRSLSALTGDLTISWNRRSRNSGAIVDGAENAPLDSTEENDYKVTIRRWAHKDYEWNGSAWVETTDTTNDEVEFLVTGATELVLTAAQIRTAELYEYATPDNPAVFGTTFTQVGGATIPESATENEQIVDLGYGEFVAFKYLDIMVQQKTNLPHSSGYGPGRWTRVVIADT